MTSIGLEINSNDLWSYILRGSIITQGDYTTDYLSPLLHWLASLTSSMKRVLENKQVRENKMIWLWHPQIDLYEPGRVFWSIE